MTDNKGQCVASKAAALSKLPNGPGEFKSGTKMQASDFTNIQFCLRAIHTACKAAVADYCCNATTSFMEFKSTPINEAHQIVVVPQHVCKLS